MKLNIAPDKSPYKTGLNMPATLNMIYLNMDEEASNERSVKINDKQLANRNYTIMTITTGSAVQ